MMTLTRQRCCSAIAGVVCVWFASPAHAQTDRRWTVAATLGLPGPGPAGDLEAAMRASGFDQPGGGCIFGLCFPPIEHPRSITGLNRSAGYPFAVQVDRRLANRGVGLSVVLSRTPLGQTIGEHAPLTNLTIDYAVDSIGFMATLERRGFAAGAGPAVHVARARDGDPQFGARPWERHTKLGALVQGRVMLPARSRFFVDASAQYRYVGAVDVGPLTPRAIFEPAAVFPRSSASFNHWLIALGGGIRF